MTTNLNKKTSEFEIVIDANTNLWKETLKKTEENLIKNLVIKGFRKGNVPLQIAKRHIAQSEIFQKSIESIINDLNKEATNHISKDIVVLGAPSYKIEKISNLELSIKFSYPIYPKFTIGNYKNLGIKYSPQEVNEKVVEDEINKISKSQIMLKDKEGTIEKGDVAIFDYEGFINDKPFEGGKANNHQLEIGSGHFIPGFEEQMIGLKSGDKKDISVIFPNDYHEKNLQGKKSIFKIHIHEVKFKELPRLDDEFAKSVGVPDVKNMSELRSYIKDIFTEQFIQNARATFQRKIFDKIIESSKDLAIPTTLIFNEMQNLKSKTEEQLKKQGISLEQYMQNLKIDKVKMDSQFKQQAQQRLKDSFVFTEIARIEKIEIKDDEYEQEYKKLAKVYRQSEESIKNTITKEQIQIPMISTKVIDKLIEYNN